MSPDTDPHDRSRPTPRACPGRGAASSPTPTRGDDGSADPALLAALTAFRDGAAGPGRGRRGVPHGAPADPARRREGRRGRRRARARRRQDPGAVDRHGRRARRPARAAGVHVGGGDAAVGCRGPAGAGRRRAHGARGIRRRHRPDRDRSRARTTEFVIRRPAVWAIAQGQPWEPSFASPEVFAGAAGERRRRARRARPRGRAGRSRRRACAAPSSSCASSSSTGLDQAELDAVLARLATRWAADDRIAVLVDSLTVKLVRAEPDRRRGPLADATPPLADDRVGGGDAMTAADARRDDARAVPGWRSMRRTGTRWRWLDVGPTSGRSGRSSMSTSILARLEPHAARGGDRRRRRWSMSWPRQPGPASWRWVRRASTAS